MAAAEHACRPAHEAWFAERLPAPGEVSPALLGRLACTVVRAGSAAQRAALADELPRRAAELLDREREDDPITTHLTGPWIGDSLDRALAGT